MRILYFVNVPMGKASGSYIYYYHDCENTNLGIIVDSVHFSYQYQFARTLSSVPLSNALVFMNIYFYNVELKLKQISIRFQWKSLAAIVI